MANSFHISGALKLAQLKQLAFKCGIPSSGTKPVLLSRIYNEISSAAPRAARSPTRILSIDMGIRNLAYCVLDVPERAASKTEQLPILKSWHRLAVSSPPSQIVVPRPTDVDAGSSASTPLAKEVFDPATLSTSAYTLLRQQLLPSNPTHVLIERQRFRTMGSKHILEWTIRVNMFESILHATLHTLKSEGLWDGTVIAVTPGKVGPFWIGEEAEDGEPVRGEGEQGKKIKHRKAKSAKLRNKGRKMDLVRQWLHDEETVTLGNKDVELMAKHYKEKWDGVSGRRKPKPDPKIDELAEEKMGKLDDLADCLLQGVAWLKWEENKRNALEFGVESLLDD